MNQKKNEAHLSPVSNISHIVQKRRTSLTTRLDPCECHPLTASNQEESWVQKDGSAHGEQMVLVSQALNARVHALLHQLLPRLEPVSLLLVHMFQLEPAPLAPNSNLLYKRRRYHAPLGLLEQVLTNVQRVIRVEDNRLLQEETGFALIFPGVDEQGAQIIVERVYGSICLLQAETLIPPLTRETTIALGMATYPEPASSLDALYQQVGRTAQSLVLRPIITTRGVKPMPALDEIPQPTKVKGDQMQTDAGNIPFMDLPRVLPTRLTQLVPFALAAELKCIPVGRDHHCLTVAMLDPTDAAALHRLHQATGMTIFPVSCDRSALHSLLTQAW